MEQEIKQFSSHEVARLANEQAATWAEHLFNTYNSTEPNPWKTFDGRDVPRWGEVSEQVKSKWTAVAFAAGKGFVGEASSSPASEG